MTAVLVSAPARLHFGMLDPAGLGARRFGGFGVGVAGPRVEVVVRATGSPDELSASGPQADRASAFARHAHKRLGLDVGLAIEVLETIPAHVGLGSGTKLGLAVAAAAAALAGADAGPESLTRLSGRGARSSVGAWTFAAPGLVVEAGVTDDGCLSPLLLRRPMPGNWRCVLALPAGAEGLSGVAEERFFGALNRNGSEEPAVARMLLTSLLPGLQAADIDEFGAALGEIQRRIGTIFAEQQGGVFHPRAAPLIEALGALGVGAVGQSCVGPDRIRDLLGPRASRRRRRPPAADRRGRRADRGRRLRPSRRAHKTALGAPVKLLVSVVSADEARRALVGGADIIDVKDPREGALGRPPRRHWPKSSTPSRAPPRSASRSATYPICRTPRRLRHGARSLAGPTT